MTLVGWQDQAVEVRSRRQGRRLRVRQQAKIVLSDEMIHCEVRNLSLQGAGISLSRRAQLPDTFNLFIAAHSLRTFKVKLRWHKGTHAGVSFEMDA